FGGGVEGQGDGVALGDEGFQAPGGLGAGGFQVQAPQDPELGDLYGGEGGHGVVAEGRAPFEVGGLRADFVGGHGQEHPGEVAVEVLVPGLVAIFGAQGVEVFEAAGEAAFEKGLGGAGDL